MNEIGRRSDSEKLVPLVGLEWPHDGIREAHRAAPAITILLSVCSVVLLFGLTLYGMASADLGLLNGVLALVKDVLIAVLGWSVGRLAT